ncbi:MAG: fibronectin type III domain-containing protein [Oscillospiraceae bacterium]|nr:fibronectin type III domain-containing protein [Oscillospiraceae bacterium]
MKKKLGSLLMALCVCLASVFATVPVFAETALKTVLTIRIGDKTYENVTNGTTIVGDFNLNDLEFWVESVNGNKLVNVGSKSTAKDDMGRNPLEIAAVPGDGRVAATLIYHAGDDPVAANQAYEFTVAGIVFTNSATNVVKKPTVGKVSSLKATAASKAVKLTWKKSSSISGYEIQYSTSKNFKSVKTVKVSKSKTSYIIKSLKGSKKYYVRIRAYKNYTDELGQKVKAVGKWSSAASTTTKK